MKVHVHPNTEDDRHYSELLAKLEHYGYEVTDVRRDAKYVIDARNPEYRGIKSIISYFDTKHHAQWQEWNRTQLKPVVCSIVPSEEEGECSS